MIGFSRWNDVHGRGDKSILDSIYVFSSPLLF